MKKLVALISVLLLPSVSSAQSCENVVADSLRIDPLELKACLARLSANQVPAGAVMAFDLPGGCPEGWRAEFDEGQGRFILGVGKGTLDAFANHRDEGGTQNHILTTSELPRHSHGGATEVNSDGTMWMNGGDTPAVRYRGQNVGHEGLAMRADTHRHGIKPEGESRPHNNMPPYVALHYCKKE